MGFFFVSTSKSPIPRLIIKHCLPAHLFPTSKPPSTPANESCYSHSRLKIATSPQTKPNYYGKLRWISVIASRRGQGNWLYTGLFSEFFFFSRKSKKTHTSIQAISLTHTCHIYNHPCHFPISFPSIFHVLFPPPHRFILTGQFHALFPHYNLPILS